MRPEWKVKRGDKEFVLYQGLLDKAHNEGLKSIETKLLQIPSEENNKVAIAVAKVTMYVDGMEKTFTGYGDAAPNNVAPAMQTCLIRMAETRSKARALRDAVNIGEAAFEELGNEEEDAFPSRGNYQSRTVRPQPTTHNGDFGQSKAEERAVAANVPAGLVNTETGEIIEENLASDAKKIGWVTPEMRFEAACRQLRVSWIRSSEAKKKGWASSLFGNPVEPGEFEDADFIRMSECYENYLDAIGDDASLRQHDVIVAEVLSILPTGAKVESFYHIHSNQWKLLSGRIRSLKLKESKKFKQRARFFALAAQEVQEDGSIGRWKTAEGKDDGDAMREWIGSTIDREIKSRTELSTEEWQLCADRLQFEMEQREENGNEWKQRTTRSR